MFTSRQLVVLAALIVGLGIPGTVNASAQVQQQNPSQCYRCTLDVDIFNVVVAPPGSGAPPSALMITPLQVPVGTPFTIQFHVIYPITLNGTGMSATLDPTRASFGFSNSSGSRITLTNVTVSPVTGQPGNYTYSSVVSPDFPTGLITVAVLENSLQDAQGNVGPPHDVTSAATLNPWDSSQLTIGPVAVTQPPGVNYLVPAIIAALIILALILFLARRQSRKTKKT